MKRNKIVYVLCKIENGNQLVEVPNRKSKEKCTILDEMTVGDIDEEWEKIESVRDYWDKILGDWFTTKICRRDEDGVLYKLID